MTKTMDVTGWVALSTTAALFPAATTMAIAVHEDDISYMDNPLFSVTNPRSIGDSAVTISVERVAPTHLPYSQFQPADTASAPQVGGIEEEFYDVGEPAPVRVPEAWMRALSSASIVQSNEHVTDVTIAGNYS